MEPSQPAAENAPPGHPSAPEILGWVLVLLGAALRIRAWSHWRSLWNDEICIAHSLVTRGLHRLLFEPLDLYQAAPPVFLALERWTIDLFGTGERTLRIPSLLAGLATLPLFFFLSRRLLNARAANLAMLLFAIVSPLVYYSAEVKQYQFDVVVTLAILLGAAGVWQEPSSRKHLILYGLAGAAGMFCSHASAFIMASSGLVLLSERWELTREKKLSVAAAFLPLLCLAIIWAGLERANFLLFIHPLANGPNFRFLEQYWTEQSAFGPREPREVAPWIWRRLDNLMGGYEVMYFSMPDMGALVTLIGAARLLTGPRRAGGWLLALPILLALLAAYWHKYPLGDRLALYTAPMLTIFVAAGIDCFWGASPMRRALALLVGAMVLGGPVVRAYNVARRPRDREELSQAFTWVADHWQPGDTIFLYRLNEAFNYYAPKTGLSGLPQYWESPGSGQPLEESRQGIAAAPWFRRAFGPPSSDLRQGNLIVLAAQPENPRFYLEQINGLAHPDPVWRLPAIGRVWMISAHDWDGFMQTLCVPAMDRLWRQADRHDEVNAVVYLYVPRGDGPK